jgi:apolipoprotein N-acyltransferase
MVFFLGIFDWILVISGYTILHHAILDLYLGSYIGLFGWVFCFIGKRRGAGQALVAAPFLWVSLEYIRSNLGFLALPWGLLAHSQYEQTPVIQIASLTGVYGISFLIVLANSAFTGALLPLADKVKGFKIGHHQKPSIRERIVIWSAAFGALAITFIYGFSHTSQPISGEAIRLSLVQGNVEQQRKWDRKFAGKIMDIYLELTQQAAEDKPNLIVWPETATPDAITRNPGIHLAVRRAAKTAGSPLLIGSARHQKMERREPGGPKYANSAFLIDPSASQGRPHQYDKIRLFPFGEYLPMKETLPWSLIRVPDVGTYESGKDFTVFELQDFRFSTTICWENMFPDLVRQFVKGGAQFIINMTNEAWFGDTAAPYQFLSMNVFRAVENNVFVIRCANTGISCFIDPHGRVVSRVRDEAGKDVFVRGTLSGSVIPQSEKTFYTKHGDLFAFLCFIVSAIFILAAVVKKEISRV